MGEAGGLSYSERDVRQAGLQSPLPSISQGIDAQAFHSLENMKKCAS